MTDILNLGAGNKPVENAINHDLRLDPARPWVTVAWDLNDLPWPWEDNSFDLIVACAVLEHLRINLLESVAECWRILRPGGILHVKLPYWNSDTSFIDPTHYWRFSLRTLDVFDPDTSYGHKYTFYTPYKWQIIQPARLNDAKTSFSAKLQVRKEAG
ncbi:MAG: class I SAM-dependent methyltransferase [Actinobacteria bacterium]|nr:class I SAM-dependent methyltransferase [Actinomycetota bacterium]